MKPILGFLTLGVNDLDNMKQFYKEKFGWTPMKDSDGIVFFKLNGFMLGLFSSHELANDIGTASEGKGFKNLTMAINFTSEGEVDHAVAELRLKGVRIVKEPTKISWGGYHSYIADPEDNYWELAYNPFLIFDKEGNVDKHV